MSVNSRVNILSDMGVNGSLIMLQNNEDFPANPALGTLVIKGYGLYAYIQIGELQTWYPFNNNKTKSYVHTQAVASSRWTITHNLNTTDVWYQVYSLTGVPVFASRSDITSNSFKLDLAEASTGTVIVVSPDTLDVPYVKAQSFTVGEGTANETVIDNSGIRVNGNYVLTSATVQPLSADLTAIDELTGNSGFLKKTGADTWSLDTNTYITGNQSISLSGDASGSGTTSINVTLGNSGVTAGTYNSVTVDAKGRVTAGTNPTTLAGYGITNAVSTSSLGIANGVATLGSDGKLTSAQLPSLGVSSYNDLTDKPTLFSGAYADLTGKPSLFSGSYTDLTNKPTLFSGAYADLTSIPTTLSGYGITDAVSSSLLGSNSGVATLDSNGKVPSSQLPSYVDDVLEYTNLAAFPASGETGKIYVDKATNLTYRWSGSTYVQVGGSSTADSALQLYTARNISASGDASWTVSFDGSANATAALTLANSGVTAGTYGSATKVGQVVVDAKGRVTSASEVTVTPAFSSITGKPTTLSGYGITDAMSGTDPTFSGTITQQGSVVSTIRAVSALSIDCSSGNYFTKTISSDSTFTFANVPSGVAYSFTLRVTQSSGSYTTGITWPAGVVWPGNNAPSLIAGKSHIFVFVTENGGTLWRGAALTNYSS